MHESSFSLSFCLFYKAWRTRWRSKEKPARPYPILGIGSMLLGYLMFRSGYLPRVLGALWVIGGLGFVTLNVVFVLAPAYASSVLLLPAILAALSLGLWLLVRGVDVMKWKEREALAAYGSLPSYHTMSPASPEPDAPSPFDWRRR